MASRSSFGMSTYPGPEERHEVAECPLLLAQFARIRSPSVAHAWHPEVPKNEDPMTEQTGGQALMQAVQQYFDLMYDADVSVFDRVFRPTAQLHGLRDGKMR